MKNQFLFIIIVVVFSINATAQLAGTLNTGFSQDGWDATIFGNNDGFYVNKTLVQPDGKILVCARAYLQSQEQQAVIARYNPNGTIDTSFGGGDGIVRSKEDTAINLHTSADGMALQNNGKIIVAGDVYSKTERIIRLNIDGSIDSTFATGGFIDITRENSAFIFHVAVQSDNKIIVCGKERRLANELVEPFVFLWRFTENGVLDTSFGKEGMVSYNSKTWLGTSEILLSINDLILLPDDSILINQTYTVAATSFLMLRKFKANGTFDASFGINGEAIKSERSKSGSYNYSSSSVQQNGSIVTSFTSQDENLMYTTSIYRLNAKGVKDKSFDIKLENPSSIPDLVQVIATPSEKIYVIKKVNPSGLSFDEIHCYDSDGKPVETFGKNGIAVINQNNKSTSYDVYAAVCSNGTIYLASDILTNVGQHLLISNVIGSDSTLAISDEIATNEITVFPNPTNGIATISLKNNALIDKVELVDSMGKIVTVATENTAEIDLTTYSSGIYVLKIYSGERIFQKKIIR